MDGYLNAEQAAARLGVRKETLYAYVSRGLIRSEESSDGRSRRYRLIDIEELEQRKEQRRRPTKTMREALHFGAPLLESELTLIRDGRIFYRGLEAVELAADKSLEQVATWIWTADFGAREFLFPTGSPELPERARAAAEAQARPWSVESLQVLVPILAASSPKAWAAKGAEDNASIGAELLRLLVEVAVCNFGVRADAESSLAGRLAAAWCPDLERRSTTRLIDTALILLADHELNVSSFTARCIASAGSPLHSAVSGGLAALHGSRHGGHTRRIEALIREAGSPDGVSEVFEDRLRRGENIPGFGQVLYPHGDPRFVAIKETVSRLFPDSEALAWCRALEAGGKELLDQHPTVDVGLAMVARTLGFPRDAALTLFALGRTVGWVGHAIEQYQQNRLIRPRARYTGEVPEGIDGTGRR